MKIRILLANLGGHKLCCASPIFKMTHSDLIAIMICFEKSYRVHVFRTFVLVFSLFASIGYFATIGIISTTEKFMRVLHGYDIFILQLSSSIR